jgi:hypothetical protein
MVVGGGVLIAAVGALVSPVVSWALSNPDADAPASVQPAATTTAPEITFTELGSSRDAQGRQVRTIRIRATSAATPKRTKFQHQVSCHQMREVGFDPKLDPTWQRGTLTVVAGNDCDAKFATQGPGDTDDCNVVIETRGACTYDINFVKAAAAQ